MHSTYPRSTRKRKLAREDVGQQHPNVNEPIGPHQDMAPQPQEQVLQELASDNEEAEEPALPISAGDEQEAPEPPVPPSMPIPPDCTDLQALHGDWDVYYRACPRWSEAWIAAHTPGLQWPSQVRIHNNRMFWNEQLCVPRSLQKLWIREEHASTGHMTSKRLWEQMQLHSAWSDTQSAREYVDKVGHECHACQATQRPHTMKAPMEYAPIPSRIMCSVSLDILHMPRIMHNRKTYDRIAVCVDRHSGWIVAVPMHDRGLMAQKVATKMHKHAWSMFGVPLVITSDLGSQFVADGSEPSFLGLASDSCIPTPIITNQRAGWKLQTNSCWRFSES